MSMLEASRSSPDSDMKSLSSLKLTEILSGFYWSLETCSVCSNPIFSAKLVEVDSVNSHSTSYSSCESISLSLLTFSLPNSLADLYCFVTGSYFYYVTFRICLFGTLSELIPFTGCVNAILTSPSRFISPIYALNGILFSVSLIATFSLRMLSRICALTESGSSKNSGSSSSFSIRLIWSVVKQSSP
jgi:hypothetical protein